MRSFDRDPQTTSARPSPIGSMIRGILGLLEIHILGETIHPFALRGREARLDRAMKQRHIDPMLGLKYATRKALGFPSEGADLLRYTMYRRLLPVMAELAEEAPGIGRALCISGGGRLATPLAQRGWEIVETQFPGVDWQSLPFDDQSFDLVLSDQVLEHVDDPFLCASESRRVLRPGGLQVHTTCLLNPIHGSPGDNWRFTPDGLRLLFSREREIAAGGWGNPLAPFVWFLPGLLFRPTPTSPRHPYNWLATWNVERWLITTWYIGRAARATPSPGRVHPDTLDTGFLGQVSPG